MRVLNTRLIAFAGLAAAAFAAPAGAQTAAREIVIASPGGFPDIAARTGGGAPRVSNRTERGRGGREAGP